LSLPLDQAGPDASAARLTRQWLDDAGLKVYRKVRPASNRVAACA
jgi:hypothetical protein